MLSDPKTGEPTRVGIKELKDEKSGKIVRIRFAKSSGAELKK
jgi:hypothetical protein